MDQPTPKTKICTSCGIRKPLDDFVIDSHKRLKKYGSICKACRGKKGELSDEDEEGGGKQKSSSLDYFAKRFMESLQEKWAEKQGEEWSDANNEELDAEKEQEEKEEKESEEKETEDKEESEELEKPIEEAIQSDKHSHRQSQKALSGEPASARSRLGDFLRGTHIIDSFLSREQPSEPTQTKQTTQSTQEQKTENKTTINTDEKIQRDHSDIEIKRHHDVTSSQLFHAEQQQTLQNTARHMAGGTVQTQTATFMVERYAKIESPKVNPAPTEPTEKSEEPTPTPTQPSRSK